MIIKRDGTDKFLLEMANVEEFLVFYLLVADKIPQILTDLNNYNLADKKKVRKILEKMYKESQKILGSIPLEQRKGKLFKL